MDEIIEVFDDVKKGIGKKGYYILIGAGVLVFILCLKKENNSDSEIVVSTNYPDTTEDLQDYETDYEQLEILAKLESMGEQLNITSDAQAEMQEELQKNFDATNNYIQSGIDSLTDLANKVDNMENTLLSFDVSESVGTPPEQATGYRDAILQDSIIIGG